MTSNINNLLNVVKFKIMSNEDVINNIKYIAHFYIECNDRELKNKDEILNIVEL